MYKKENIDEAKAMKEDWLKNKNNQMEEFLIDIGAAAKDDLSKAKVATEKKDQFLSFDIRKQWVDVFLHDYLSINSQYKELWSICKLIFILKHRESFTERDFSINKEISNWRHNSENQELKA